MNRSPYLTAAPSVTSIMLKVMLALVPGIAAYIWVFGGGILVTLTLASLTAILAEVLMLKLRERPVRPFVTDGSALVTAWLLALALPPLAPWWLIVLGTAIAIVVAKQLYGGLGYNPFNPAMVGYAALLISFPLLMTSWPAPLALAEVKLGFVEQMHFIFSGALPAGAALDAVTSATPLDYLKTQLTLNHGLQDIVQAPIFGMMGGQGVELIAAAYLLGGLYLIQQRIITWHLPTAFLAAMAIIAGIFYLADASRFADPAFHLFSGATMLCAFFIITDPVSGPTTPKGKLIFAAGIGLMTYLIRVYGGYPDGVAFAVIFFNICVPLIDAYTQPRVFGHEK
ncbi:MAG: electron transport complex subunit RsxD [Betaproteobacteria bacterium HGW-Betaproteobacteria-8]|nr:MAG: electron transport complex subunit RsxD [Betaproteobacteria bacterium HGW-Betaproteobacteria-8]